MNSPRRTRGHLPGLRRGLRCRFKQLLLWFACSLVLVAVFRPALPRMLQAAIAEDPPPDRYRCDYFFAFLSRPDELGWRAREAVRDTWFAEFMKDPRVQYRFFVGRGDWTYAAWEDDVVELPFQDSYTNLSVKVAHIMRWPERNRIDCKFIVKSDDDIYMRPERFRAVLQSLPRQGLVYAGLTQHQDHIAPIRRRGSKWYISKKSYPLKEFPPYMRGPLYILSSNLARALPYSMIKSGNDELPSTYFYRGPNYGLFKLEDALMGDLVRRVGGARFVELWDLYVEPRTPLRCKRMGVPCNPQRLLDYTGVFSLTPRDFRVMHVNGHLCPVRC